MNDSSPRATGQCHCGAIRYSMTTAVQHHALCHCSDCRRHAGAPMVGWALVGQDEIEITGTPKIYASSEHGRRHFCGECGTGLFYTSEAIFPGQIDVQSATLDDPEPHSRAGADPDRRADRVDGKAGQLPAFERYPPFE